MEASEKNHQNFKGEKKEHGSNESKGGAQALSEQRAVSSLYLDYSGLLKSTVSKLNFNGMTFLKQKMNFQGLVHDSCIEAGLLR